MDINNARDMLSPLTIKFVFKKKLINEKDIYNTSILVTWPTFVEAYHLGHGDFILRPEVEQQIRIYYWLIKIKYDAILSINSNM